MKKLVAVASAALTASCIAGPSIPNPDQVRVGMNRQIGLTESAILETKGSPTREIGDGGGGKILIYEIEAAPAIATGGETVHFSAGTSFKMPTTISSPITINVEYYVDRNHLVYGWRFGGLSNFRHDPEPDSKPTVKTNEERSARISHTADLLNALNDWEADIRKHDPNFGDITNPDDPKHGLTVADRVFDALQLKWKNHPEITAPQLVAEAQRVYDLAHIPAPAASATTNAATMK